MKYKNAYVYILSNYNDTVFYTGVTSNLYKRMYEHSNKLVDGFTKNYNINKLLYYEIHSDIREAILREKKIKKYKREWKWRLIDSVNSERKNLYINGEIISLDSN